MEIRNKVNNGMHLDFSEWEQPEGTMRYNRNGIITDLEDGAFIWKNHKGTFITKSKLPVNEVIIGHCLIRDKLYMIVLNSIDQYVVIYRSVIDDTGNMTDFIKMWEGNNTELNLSLDYPIRAMFGFYENENTQRIYWTDFNNPPRVINIGAEDVLNIEEKFVNLFPSLSSNGTISLSRLENGGSCKAGTYFFALRLYKDGYYTDWTHLTTSIPIYNEIFPEGTSTYHNNQGAAPDENVGKKVVLTLNDIDNDYERIQVATFYSNARNSAEPGFIFFDGLITNTNMDVTLNGNENFGTVTIDDLINISSVITKCKDMTHISNINVLANIEERKEIDLTTVAPYNENDEIEVSILPLQHGCLLDTQDRPNTSWSVADEKPLYGIGSAKEEYGDLRYLMPNIWYQARSTTDFTDDGGVQSYPAGTIFQVNGTSRVNYTFSTGNLWPIMVIVLRKYIPFGADSDINNHENKIINVTGFYNYKNPLFSEHLKGYPGGETIRFGIVFYDLTGRPFFARHLYNTEYSYNGKTIGPGDHITIPRDQTKQYGVSNGMNLVSNADGVGYRYITGNIIGVDISGIDISDIKDQISGFSIVRAPIERTKLAYGYIVPLIEDGSVDTIRSNGDLYVTTANSYKRYAGGYLFYSPEEIFELEDYSIQTGDKLVNSYYMRSDFANTRGGKGDKIVANEYGHYHRLTRHTLIGDVPSNSNAQIGASHEILNSVRYKIGDAADEGIVFDPTTPGALFRDLTYSADTSPYYSYVTNCTILTLDINESSENSKDKYESTNSNMITAICHIERENNNPYGGLSKSSLANTKYISTGHYQEINSTVLTNIHDGSGNYIFNGIHVYGGDAFIGLFCHPRILKNEDKAESQWSDIIGIPLESRVNIDLKEGNHVGRDRVYAIDNPNGIRWKANENKLEEYNYNDGYSTDDINDYYTAYPFNTQLSNIFDSRIRFSNVKTNGEIVDAFRQFNSNSRIDINSVFGALTNIKARNNRLIYWQRDMVGYIPINERALTPDQFGQPVQLGVGGAFERYDEIITMLGNSNQFGLVESPLGFHWYDAVRKVMITLTDNMKFDKDSLIKGMDSWFKLNTYNNMDLYDNPINSDGIIGAYDPMHKLIFMTFKRSGEDTVAVGVDMKTNKFIGIFDFPAKMYMNYKNYLYSIDETSNKIYQHGAGIPGAYHETTYPSYFDIIIKGGTNEAKIFDNFEYIGNSRGFTKLIFDTNNQSIEEFCSSNKNLKYRNRRWYGNFPKVERERLLHGWLKVRFFYQGGNEVTFFELLTNYRKAL